MIGSRLSHVIRRKKLLGAASLTVADVSGKAIGLVMTPYLANHLGAAGFGALNLYMSAAEIIGFLLFLGGPGLLTAEYVRNGYTSARRLRAANLRLSLWITLAMLVATLPVSWLAPASVPLAVGALIVAVSYVQGLNTVELSYYRGAQSYAFPVGGQFGFAVLNVLLTVIAFDFLSPSPTNRLLSVALAGAAVQLLYVIELSRQPYESASREARRVNTSLIISFGLSIFVHVASAWIRASVDRFVLSGAIGLAAGGVYSVAFTMAMVPAVFFSAVSQQLQPYLYRRLKHGDFTGFNRIQFWYVWLVVGVIVLYYIGLLAAFGRLFASEYEGAKALFPALLAGSAAQSIYSVSSHAAFYERRGGHISVVTGGALLIHLLGLGTLAAYHSVTPNSVALLFFGSTTVATLGMAYLSHRTVRQLRRVSAANRT